MTELFDMELRARRRDRAARMGAEMFLVARAFDDCLERIELMDRRFARALLIGCPDPCWPGRVPAAEVIVRDPGPIFAGRAGGAPIVEDRWVCQAEPFDLVLTIGTLDTVNDLPRALSLVRRALSPGGLFIGAISGGDTLPRLRAAMRAADSIAGAAAAHVHPRIEPSALAPLLEQAGFIGPVVDVDRVAVSYRSLHALVADLRAMGVTNILTERPRHPLGKAAFAAAAQHFDAAGDGERTTETFEILHFAAWAPGHGSAGR